MEFFFNSAIGPIDSRSFGLRKFSTKIANPIAIAAPTKTSMMRLSRITHKDRRISSMGATLSLGSHPCPARMAY
jgi:hypothetical protein